MAKVVKIFTTIRNNWKKSAFAAVAFSYGVSYSNEKYELVSSQRVVNFDSTN